MSQEFLKLIKDFKDPSINSATWNNDMNSNLKKLEKINQDFFSFVFEKIITIVQNPSFRVLGRCFRIGSSL